MTQFSVYTSPCIVTCVPVQQLVLQLALPMFISLYVRLIYIKNCVSIKIILYLMKVHLLENLMCNAAK